MNRQRRRPNPPRRRRTGNNNPGANTARICPRVSSGTGPALRDRVTNKVTVNLYDTLSASHSTGGVAFGLGNTYVQANSTRPYYQNVISQYVNLYEQYTIRRIRVYATCGKNMNNHIRVKTQVVARVDTDNLATVSTPSSLGQVMGSAGTVTRTLTERGNVLIADFNPVCKAFEPGASQTDGHQNPVNNRMQWYGLANMDKHKWLGATNALITPDQGYTPSNAPTIILRIRCDLELRGRIIAAAAFAPTNITLPPPLIGATFDVDAIGRTYTVVSADDLNVVVSYSSVTADESLTLTAFTGYINSSLWFGNPITNWTGPFPL